ncbi:MAG: hypothetical protein ACO3LH_05615 [Steroidobacteraceae bacterium]
MNVPSYRFNVHLSNKLPWRYFQLRDVELVGTGCTQVARLICEDGEGGDMIVAFCPRNSFASLTPYLELHTAWKADPYDVEQPVVPIHFNALGQARFSVAGADLAYAGADQIELPERVTAGQQALFERLQNAARRLESPAFRAAIKAHLRKIHLIWLTKPVNPSRMAPVDQSV